MRGVKVVVIYPRPQDENAFEEAYTNVHLPMVENKLKGISRMVATRVLSSPDGEARTYRMAELHFSSMEQLEKSMASEGGKQVLDHAVSISTGGKPIIYICEEETFLYW